MKAIVVGVDIAKRVFQLHWVEPETGEIVALQLKREKFLEHFANRSKCLIGMEACGGSQHWARSLQKLGHEVKLMSGRMVKPFVVGNKNDAADARGIWMAVQQPGLKAVAVKSEEQQAVLALHRMREQLVKFRTAQSNGLCRFSFMMALFAFHDGTERFGQQTRKNGLSSSIQVAPSTLPVLFLS
jgi:transposase